MDKNIYLDNAATTPVRPEVVEAMTPFHMENYGNPSGLYEIGTKSREAVEAARKVIADSLLVKPEEIYFTSGGTEADNWALKAIAFKNRNKSSHIITSKIEHHAILHTCNFLETMGIDVTYIDVDENGIVDLKQLENAIRPDTILISIMFANNEIGTIQPINEISAIAKKHDILFHTDAVQAFGHLKINIEEYNFDMLSVSAHKFNGPKGVGFLYANEKTGLDSFIHGGGQERKKRAGTENVAGIVGMAKAVEIAMQTMEERSRQEILLRDYIIKRVENEIPYVRLNGHRKKRLSNNTNFCIQFIEGETLILMLDMEGICAASGSACSSGSKKPSHVLMALGLPENIVYSALRITVSENNTIEEIDFAIDTLKRIVTDLRKNSEEYNEYLNCLAENKKNLNINNRRFRF